MSKWISVNDRMPEIPKDRVGSDAVMIAQGVHHKMLYLAFYRLDGWVDFGSNEKVDRPSLISHWMSLPEPPKEKKYGD